MFECSKNKFNIREANYKNRNKTKKKTTEKIYTWKKVTSHQYQQTQSQNLRGGTLGRTSASKQKEEEDEGWLDYKDC